MELVARPEWIMNETSDIISYMMSHNNVMDVLVSNSNVRHDIGQTSYPVYNGSYCQLVDKIIRSISNYSHSQVNKL